jgi:hypothetical protein
MNRCSKTEFEKDELMSLNPKPQTLNMNRCSKTEFEKDELMSVTARMYNMAAFFRERKTLNPKPWTLNAKPWTLHLKVNPALNPKP